MPFTAHDLRYKPEQSFPLLYAYLHRNAQRYLGGLKYDAYEVDVVIGHVIEQLVRLGIFGGGNAVPQNALDHLTDAQFYAFLSRSVRNKAIDRLRKTRIPISSSSELEKTANENGDDNPLNDAVESVWGGIPFASPEEITLALASQQGLRNLLKHCIMTLGAAPRQLQAVIQELQEMGADDLLHNVLEDLNTTLTATALAPSNEHVSQHKDHAHKKLRHCLQQQSTNLTVTIALRLTEYGIASSDKKEYMTEIQTLAQHDLQESDVRVGLNALVAENLLTWYGEQVVRCTAAQMKRLHRFYREE